jgi:branched-chain amino acid transport system ATP-binding protein
VLLAGEDITAQTPWQIQRRGLARGFQRSAVFARLTALENLGCAALCSLGHRHDLLHLLRRFDRLDEVSRRAQATLDRIGLRGRRDVPAAELSYAEQRALDLGIALASDPALLLLDEPTAGLSAEETRAAVDMLRDLKRNRSILIVEHDMDVAFGLADRVCVLARGSVVAQGEPARIRDDTRVAAIYFGASAPR